MNKIEQVIKRLSTEDTKCKLWRTQDEVFVLNGAAMARYTCLDKIGLSGNKADYHYMKWSEKFDEFVEVARVPIQIPNIGELREFCNEHNYPKRRYGCGIDLTEFMSTYNGQYEGALRVDVWRLIDLVNTLGKDLECFWTGEIVYRIIQEYVAGMKFDVARIKASYGLYLRGSNGSAILLPMEIEG